MKVKLNPPIDTSGMRLETLLVDDGPDAPWPILLAIDADVSAGVHVSAPLLDAIHLLGPNEFFVRRRDAVAQAMIRRGILECRGRHNDYHCRVLFVREKCGQAAGGELSCRGCQKTISQGESVHVVAGDNQADERGDGREG